MVHKRDAIRCIGTGANMALMKGYIIGKSKIPLKHREMIYCSLSY
jgi:hypothetical protein